MNASVISLSALALLACATPSASGQPLRHRISGYELEVLVDGAPAETFQHRGGSYVLGGLGQRYVLRVHNRTGRRVEAVVSVDGRDVIDGKAADFRRNRGYLVPAWGFVDIDGWRTSSRQVAAFRFSAVADSYAARMGNAREVGVVGVAVFPERHAPRPLVPYYDYDRRGYDSHGYDRGDAPRSKSGARADTPAERSEPSAPAPSASTGPGAAADDAPLAEVESAGGRSGDKAKSAPRRRPGLGTEFGEDRYSPVHEVHFVRADASRPTVVIGARYNDRDGLLAMGIDVDGLLPGDDVYLRQTAHPFPVSHPRYATPPPGWRR